MSVRPVQVLLLLLCACSKAPQSSPPIPSIQCVPRALGAEGLDDEWQPFAAHLQACVVVDPAGIPALEILTVSAQSFYGERAQGSATVVTPLPAILLPGGKLAGRLPYNYPDDPPRATTLEFSVWQAGLPGRITMRVRDPRVTGDHAVVLLLDAAARKYAAEDPQ